MLENGDFASNVSPKSHQFIHSRLGSREVRCKNGLENLLDYQNESGLYFIYFIYLLSCGGGVVEDPDAGQHAGAIQNSMFN